MVLSLVRKVTSVEGELIIPRAGYFYLVNSNFKDEKLHLEFRPKEEVEKKRGKIILLTLDGKFENDKITGVLQSSLGKKPQKIVLKREPGSSLHKILQSHMPHL